MKNFYSPFKQLVLILFLILPLVGRTQSFDPTHVYKIVSKYTGKVLEVGGDNKYEPDHIINQWEYGGGAHQQWRIETLSDGTYRFRNRNSNLYMEMFPQHALYPNTVINTSVFQRVYSSYAGQRWYLRFIPQNNAYIITDAKLDLSINSIEYPKDMTNITVDIDRGLIQQQWEIIDVSTNIWTTTMYNVNSNWVLSATDSRRVTQDKSYSIANQEWTFESIGNNIWAIYSRSNHLALEIGGDDPTTYKAGTPANVWEYTGKTNQQWRIIDDYGNNLTLTDGSPTPVPIPRAIPFYHIINVRTGYALEIGGSTTERLQTNRPANQWPYSGGNHQKWRFGSGDLNRNAPTNPDITPTITFTPAIATITTATDNYDENTNFSVYPNPVQNYLFISSTGMKKVATAQLIDSQGKTSVIEVGPNGKMNIEHLSAGIYILNISSEKGVQRRKIIKY